MSFLRYCRESWRCRRQWQDSAPSWQRLWHWRRPWLDSIAPVRSSVADERPWITYGAEEFLAPRLTGDSHVFEWGSGGSSLFFARHVAQVVSIEHDAAWLARVKDAFQRRQLTNWRGILVPPATSLTILRPESDDCDGYVSDADEYRGFNFRAYASRIDAYPDETFDIVMIDGRARPSCLKHALPKVRAGGCLVWDNSERDYYAPAMRMVPADFERHDFPGPGPYVRSFWRTTIWVRGGRRAPQRAA